MGGSQKHTEPQRRLKPTRGSYNYIQGSDIMRLCVLPCQQTPSAVESRLS